MLSDVWKKKDGSGKRNPGKFRIEPAIRHLIKFIPILRDVKTSDDIRNGKFLESLPCAVLSPFTD